MGFKDIIQRMGSKGRENREQLSQMVDQMRLQKLAEERQLSSNERELNRFMQEDREEEIKKALEMMRKKRERDINFGHNPLDTPNITNSTEWEVLKERNQFSNKSNMFANQKNILKSNRNLLKNNKRLFGL